MVLLSDYVPTLIDGMRPPVFENLIALSCISRTVPGRAQVLNTGKGLDFLE